jgi:hypothetical protein
MPPKNRDCPTARIARITGQYRASHQCPEKTQVLRRAPKLVSDEESLVDALKDNTWDILLVGEVTPGHHV